MVNCASLNQIKKLLCICIELLSFKLRFMGETQSLWGKAS